VTVPQRRTLIEDWLPITELGIESRRERAVSSTLPPIFRLHVWWARRPLAASVAVMLGGLMPAWDSAVAAFLTEYLSALPPSARNSLLSPRPAMLPRRDYVEASEAWYRDWLLHLAGIWGDPVAGRRRLAEANANGLKLQGNGYGYKQAYRNQIALPHVDCLHALLRWAWGNDDLPLVLDATAGGGSIPFTSARLGIPTHANDLNGVAAAVLETGIQIPARYGLDLLADLESWGRELVSRVDESLKSYFPLSENESVIAYIHVNAVACPRTGRLVPLLPDLWLRKEAGKQVAIRLTTQLHGVALDRPVFEIVRGSDIDFDPKRGILTRGAAISPYDDLVIDGSYIKAEAQTGRMTQVMYAIAVRKANGVRDFRVPTSRDLDALTAAGEELRRCRADWERDGLIPVEEISTVSNYDRGHRMYGINTWADMFTPRQLLVHGTFTREFQRIVSEVRAAMDPERAVVVLMELALLQGKALNWNSRASSWNQMRQGLRSTFDKHNFAFKWTFAEFEGAVALYPWTLHVIDNYRQIAELLDETGINLTTGERLPRSVRVTQGNAADIYSLDDKTVAHLCMDPPYYDNVMYGELADFFYVWEKNTLGFVRPALFQSETSDVDNEAVANPARFAALGSRKKALADADYEAKMTAIFAEARRVLRDDGVLSVMFTHKRAEAWDTLGMGLLKAGFTIETSWPVNTEAEHSLHQSGLNSAASTIMLVCRKREAIDGSSTQVYLEDIEGEVRRVARDAVARFREDGIDGVDLMLSAYGPTLSVVSRHWPVHSSEADEQGRARLLRPEEALNVARSEIVRIQRARLVGFPVEFDPLTDFTVAFWDVIRDDTSTFDEARRLALAVGNLGIDELEQARILVKQAGTVRLLAPSERVRARGTDDVEAGVRAGAPSFSRLVDAVHTVCYVAEGDGLGAAKALMDRAGLSKDGRFIAAVQAMVNAVPRVKVKGSFLLPLAGTLDRIATAYLPNVLVPAEEVQPPEVRQGDLFQDVQL
jgi:putative DNA methylase